MTAGGLGASIAAVDIVVKFPLGAPPDTITIYHTQTQADGSYVQQMVLGPGFGGGVRLVATAHPPAGNILSPKVDSVEATTEYYPNCPSSQLDFALTP